MNGSAWEWEETIALEVKGSGEGGREDGSHQAGGGKWWHWWWQ